MRFYLFKAVTALFVFGGFSFAKEKRIDKLAWLLGAWEESTSKGKIYETWTRKTDAEFYGKTYKLKSADTVYFEKVRLVEEGGLLFYIPTVKDQNNELPVRFRQKSFTESKIIFENQEHDFPQLISYTRINKDSLVAQVWGKENGQFRSDVFPMKRIR